MSDPKVEISPRSPVVKMPKIMTNKRLYFWISAIFILGLFSISVFLFDRRLVDYPENGGSAILMEELAARGDLKGWLELRVHCDKSEYKVGEQIYISYEIINKSLNMSYSMLTVSGGYGTITIDIYDKNRKIHVKQNDSPMQFHGSGNYRTYRPGFVYKGGFTATDAFILNVAGDYEIQAHNEFQISLGDPNQIYQGLVQCRQGFAKSEKIHITIK
jgi:hypothetical protein